MEDFRRPAWTWSHMHNLIFNRFDNSRHYSFATRSKKLFRTCRNTAKRIQRIEKDIESTCKEMDATRSIINEFVTKSLGNNQK